MPSRTGKTWIWSVDANKDGRSVGTVLWYGGWRKYVFSPSDIHAPIFEEVCLREIADFIEARTREWHAQRK
jgi:hypothetical protein